MGCTALQVFTASPRQWRAPAVTDEMVRDFKAAQEKTGLTAVVSHDSYLINLISTIEGNDVKSFDGLKREMGRCAQYGIRWVVSHLASYKDQEQGAALVKLAERVTEILAETDPSVTLLMETTAGQGSSVNSRFEEIAMLLELTKGPKRFGVCLDTCHVFAAGYDIRTPETYAAMWAEFDRLVGRDRVKVIHCNDSLKPLGSRVDRHAEIGEGLIGPVAFQELVNDPKLEQIPIVLETDAETHQQNLDRLKSYRR